MQTRHPTLPGPGPVDAPGSRRHHRSTPPAGHPAPPRGAPPPHRAVGRACAAVLCVVAVLTGIAVLPAPPAAARATPHPSPGAASAGPAGAVPAGDRGYRGRRGHRRPVPGVVVRAVDIPDHPWERGHRGVDLAASPGDPVRASAAGTVVFAGTVAGTPVVSVDHGGGLRTTYEPVVADVRRGDVVARGAVIGRLADAATLPPTARRGPGLSWGARIVDPAAPDGRYIDPMSLLGRPTVRLWA